MGFLNEMIKPFLKKEKAPELSSQVEPQNVINDLHSDYFHTTGSFFDSASTFMGKSEQVDNVFRHRDKIMKYRQVATIPDVNDGKPDKFNDDLCESYKICPLFMNKAAPVGKLCPLEKFKVNRITQELINELDIDIFEDYTDKYIIGELVTYSLIEDRAARALASSSLGLTTITLGKNGKEYKKTKSFFLDVISEMGKRKADSRKSLIATRDEKQRIKNEKGVGQNKDKFDELVSLIENRNNKKNNGLLFSEAELIDDKEGENNG